MVRVAQARSATLEHVFQSDGTATDPAPDSATVTITRADGTALVTDAPTTEAGVGTVTYTLTPADTATLDTFTVLWKASFGGQVQTYKEFVEVAGGFLFSLADARAVPPLNDTAKYPAKKVTATRTLVEQALEDACGVAFVPRFTLETFSGKGSTTIMLSQPKVRAVRSITRDDVAVTGSDLTSAKVAGTGVVYWPSVWSAGYSNFTVGYEHGYDGAPERVKRAALKLTKNWLIEGPVDDRATSMSTEDGTFSLVTPGVRGALFGIPEVEAVVQQYGMHVAVA